MLLIDKESSKNLYTQLYEGLKQQILSGELPTGFILPGDAKNGPGIRIVPQHGHHGLPTTRSRRYIYSTQGSGFYVESLPPQPCEQQENEKIEPAKKERAPHYDFRYGGIDRNIYRNRAFRHSLNNALADRENCGSLLYEALKDYSSYGSSSANI